MGDYTSTQMADDYRARPTEDHGKLRLAYFKFTATEAGADGSTVDLCKLPAGAVRILPNLSRYNVSALGASRVMDIGHRAYYKDWTDTEVAEDGDAFVADDDVSAAVEAAALGTGVKFDVYSTGGVTIFATVTGGTIPIGAVIEGFVAYAYE